MIYNVSAGQSPQTVINQAQLGDVINLEAGASFQGPIEIPSKSGSGELVIQSSRASELPAGRVNPSHAPLMPKIVCPNYEQAIRTKAGAHHYKLDGIEVLPTPNMIEIYDLVRLGGGRNDQTTLASVPHHIKIDRCYIHGSSTDRLQRGISLNSSDTEITRSYLSDLHWPGYDSQAICSWNTPGRNRIVDNYLEAASENILLGGSDPYSADFIPSDYQILRNHCFKPLTWRGAGLNVKNLLELKNARNVLIDGNVFENNWTDGQAGIPILFTVRNQDGTAPYSIILNVTFSNNIVKNTQGALNLLGTDNEKPSARCSGLVIRNNVFDKITGPFLTMNGYHNVTLDRNTSLQVNNLMTLYGEPSEGFRFTGHLCNDHDYGIFGDGGLIGTSALNRWTPGFVMDGCVIATPYGSYPPGNQYPTTPITIPADYRSPFPNVGADIDQLLAAQGGTITPTPIPPTTPTPTPPTLRKVPWPSGEAKQNAILNAQWLERYRFKRHLSGAYAEFESVN